MRQGRKLIKPAGEFTEEVCVCKSDRSVRTRVILRVFVERKCEAWEECVIARARERGRLDIIFRINCLVTAMKNGEKWPKFKISADLSETW